MKYGFIKVASAVPMVKVGDVKYNVEQIENLTVQAEGKGVEVIVFPELSVTGYSCQDLFSQNLLLEVAEQGVMMLLDFTRKLDIITICRSTRSGRRPVAQLRCSDTAGTDIGHCAQDLSAQLQRVL